MLWLHFGDIWFEETKERVLLRLSKLYRSLRLFTAAINHIWWDTITEGWRWVFFFMKCREVEIFPNFEEEDTKKPLCSESQIPRHAAYSPVILWNCLSSEMYTFHVSLVVCLSGQARPDRHIFHHSQWFCNLLHPNEIYERAVRAWHFSTEIKS